VYGYAYFIILYVHAVKLLPGFSGYFWDKVWIFLVKTGWQLLANVQQLRLGLCVPVLPFILVVLP